MVAVNYDWDGIEDNIVEEYDDAGATVAEYTTEPHLYGELISQRRSGQSTFYSYDILGSTLALTDSTGQVTDTKAYTAFGEVSEQSGSTVNPFSYVGKVGYYTVLPADLIYVRHRNYDPTLITWTCVDTIRTRGLPDDVLPMHTGLYHWAYSPYRYADNSPTHKMDPDGRLPNCNVYGDAYKHLGRARWACYKVCVEVPFVFMGRCGRRLENRVACCAPTRSPNPSFKPITNGCSWVPDRPLWMDFTQCCNQHDVCYQTCNSHRQLCDIAFGVCLRIVCERYTIRFGLCLGIAGAYYGEVRDSGQDAWVGSQLDACMWRQCNCPLMGPIHYGCDISECIDCYKTMANMKTTCPYTCAGCVKGRDYCLGGRWPV